MANVNNRVCYALSIFLAFVSVLSYTFFPGFLSTSVKVFDFAVRTEVDIAIGVLSARHNFEERQSLRDTWFGFAQGHTRLLPKFVVGTQECHVPPDYRKTPYVCSPVNLSNEHIYDEMTVVNPSRLVQREEVDVSLPSRISFRVQHPIVVRRLGLLWRAGSPPITSSFSVTLFDDINEEEVVQVSFSSSSPGVRVGDYLFKPVERFVLPKNFEASVVVASHDPGIRLASGRGSPITLETGGNVIFFFQNKWCDPVAENLPCYSEETPDNHVGNFMFVIHEPEALLTRIRQREHKMQEWSDEAERVRAQLEVEIQAYGDILLVEAVDTYENLPLKMLLFHKWLSESIKFKYFVKTDDDCFVNIHLILKEMERETFLDANLWWGNFRHNWAVQHHGKWAEYSYPSTAYPAFACGSGNVLSVDLVMWIAKNYRYLHLYQGEDVSMAIWLSAILPTYVDDKRWSCDEECAPDMLASAEHSTDEIKQLWANWTTCGNPCECTSQLPSS